MKKSEVMAFVLAFAVSVVVLSYLFRFWLLIYVVLFFISAWSLAPISFRRRWVKGIILGYFFGYILSAVIGFWFLGVA